MACARSTRVLKKIEPNQAGALKWAQRYGASLLCVAFERPAAFVEHRTVDNAPGRGVQSTR